jgi:Skp family chaperone for outer membrane proteins
MKFNLEKIMKTSNIIITILLIAVIAMSFGFGNAIARGKVKLEPPKVGIISLRGILEKCDKNVAENRKFAAEGKRITSQLEKLQEDTVALEAVIKTRKPGSSDYMDKMQQLIEKKAMLDAKDKFYQQKFALEQQQWAEKLFQEVVVITGEFAKSQGIDIVLAREEFEFPIESSNELMLTIKTGKVIYYADKLDITADVLAAVNAKK